MTTDLALNVEYISVDHLIPYAKNARTHCRAGTWPEARPRGFPCFLAPDP